MLIDAWDYIVLGDNLIVTLQFIQNFQFKYGISSLQYKTKYRVLVSINVFSL